MKNIAGRLLTTFVVSSFVIGCGKGGTSFSLLSTENSFKQTSGTANSKIDIMWVIDNSGSMDSSQTNLINNLNSFISDFSNKGLDYQMVVTATDGWRDLFVANQTKCSAFRDGPLNGSCNVTGTHSGVPMITFLTPDPVGKFNINGRQGVSGSGDERAFQSIKAALDNPLNGSFLRNDSFLTIIIVSDEDDFSHDGSSYITNQNDSRLHNPQIYLDYLDAKTNSTSTNRRYNVNAMAIWDPTCLVSLNSQFGGRVIGQRYGQLVDSVNTAFTLESTKGLKASLCDNFADDLENIATNIISLASRFTLARIPIPSTIVVKVNGAVVPNEASNPLADGGWVYESATNSIVFIGTNYIPPAGSDINVTYDPLYYGE